MLLALLLLQATLSTPTSQVGVILTVDDPGARLVLREGLQSKLGRETRWNCRETAVCLEVVAVPIVVGKASTGWAVAARFSQRLKVSPQWPGGLEKPEAKGQKPAVEIIEDTTAFGEVACTPCEEAKAECQRQLGELKAFARERFEDLGGLFLQVGPPKSQFLRQVAEELAGRLLQQLGEGGAP